MIIGSQDTDDSVFVIAEVGNNHEGDLESAREHIREAAKAGANAVKFQTIIPDRLVSSDQTDRIRQLSRFQFSRSQFEELAEVALRNGVLFMSTPFDVKAVDWLDPLVPAFKIASGDNDFFPLLDRVARTGKPVLVSLGFGGESSAGTIAEFFNKTWSREGITGGELALLHCVASYPTPEDQANLGAIRRLARFDVTVGYSDHTLGIKAVELAVASGARIIEKHFTLDKSRSTFRDHQLSADPTDLRELVDAIRRVETFLDPPGDMEADSATNLSARRSIAVAHDMEAGSILEPGDLIWVRPGTGLRPGEEATILGRRLNRAIPAGELIQRGDIE